RPPGSQADDDQLVEVGVAGEERRHRLLDDPAEVRVGQMAAERGQDRQRVDNVAQRARAEEEDAHAPPSSDRQGATGSRRTREIRSLVAWSFGSPTNAVRPP